jgi:branched-chain amino acid transport system substrate-binding protein
MRMAEGRRIIPWRIGAASAFGGEAAQGAAMKRAGALIGFFLIFVGPAAVSEELRVGLIAPLTGTSSDVGTSCLEGAQLAVGEANRDGGILCGGKRLKVVLIVKDDQGSPEKALIAAQELINQERISALIGPPMSTTAIPVAKLADKAMVPMISQSATNPDLTMGKRWVFRSCFTDDSQPEALARFASSVLGVRTAAILFNVANEYSRTVAGKFTSAFQKQGGRVVASETYATGAVDFLPMLARIKTTRPDALFLPNYQNELKIQVDQIRVLNIATQILGVDTMGFREPQDIVKAEGVYYTTHFSAEIPTEAVKKLNASYQLAYNRAPTPIGALTYDAFGILFSAVERAGSGDTEALGAILRSLGRYEGVTGTMDFRGSPDPRKSVVIVHVLDGSIRFITQITP